MVAALVLSFDQSYTTADGPTSQGGYTMTMIDNSAVAGTPHVAHEPSSARSIRHSPAVRDEILTIAQRYYG